MRFITKVKILLASCRRVQAGNNFMLKARPESGALPLSAFFRISIMAAGVIIRVDFGARTLSRSVPIRGTLRVVYNVYTVVYTAYRSQWTRSKVMKARMVKWGNSLAVRIPKPIIEEARLKEGDFLEIEAGDGRIELRRPTKIPTLAQLVSQITPDNRYPEISTGPEVGKERVEW
ncbi:MAG: AbrB/MazE/SpoVT family DNA-binding domain-containing protein [Candidatus Sulfotelmatobacter sp.]